MADWVLAAVYNTDQKELLASETEIFLKVALRSDVVPLCGDGVGLVQDDAN